MEKAQVYLENKYPSYIRKNIKWINITNNNLQGELDLSEFTNLETFWCSYNSITKLNSLEKTNLKSLRCCNNQINELDFDFLTTLKEVDCDNNPLNFTSLDVAHVKLVNELRKQLLKESEKKNKNLAKRNDFLRQRVEKSEQNLNRLLEIVADLPDKEEIVIKNNLARKEIKIIQPEPDEKQIELEIEVDEVFEDQEEQIALKRLKNLETTYNRINTYKLETKQQKRQFQILVPAKK